jgi:hypothetical protein
VEYRRSKKAKEPPIDEHLTLGLHGKSILTTPSAGKSPVFGLLENRSGKESGVASGKAPSIACSVNAAVGPNLHRSANTAVGNCHKEGWDCHFEQGAHAVHFINQNVAATYCILYSIYVLYLIYYILYIIHRTQMRKRTAIGNVQAH